MKTMARYTKKLPDIILFIGGAILILAIIFATTEMTGITHFINQQKQQTVNQTEQSKTDLNNKKNLIENKNGNNQTIYQDHSSSDIILSTRREANNSITILSQLNNYSDGTCELSIVNGEKSFSQSVSVLYIPSNSTCEGFNVPIASLGAGSWQITIKVTSKGKVSENKISLEVL